MYLSDFHCCCDKRLHKSSLKQEAFISQSVGIVLHGEKAHVAGL